MTLRAMLDPAILPAYASSAWRIGRRAVRGHRRFPGDARAIARACVEAGADMIFPEAITELSMYRKFADAVGVPILANLTEFGQTPLFTTDEIAGAGVAIALYPLSAFRAMNQAALNVYEALRRDGTQKAVVDTMQTRNDLYDFLGYHAYEQKLDQLFAGRKP